MVLALISASANAIALFTLPFLPLPPPVVWPFLGVSVLFHTGYNVFLAQSYRHGDLGHVYPIARGTAPLIVAIASRIVVGETLHPLTVVAVLLIAIGIISLAFGGERPIGDYPHRYFLPWERRFLLPPTPSSMESQDGWSRILTYTLCGCSLFLDFPSRLWLWRSTAAPRLRWREKGGRRDCWEARCPSRLTV